MKLFATNKGQQNESILDPWSLVHAGMGLAVGLVDIPLSWALAGSLAYEIIERPFEMADFGKNFFNVSKPENFGNRLADVVVFMIAAEAGRRWNRS